MNHEQQNYLRNYCDFSVTWMDATNLRMGEVLSMKTEQIKAGEWFEPHLAFPNKQSTGMTLRDYFAAQAMPIALKILMHDYTRDDKNWFWKQYVDNEMLTELAYGLADQMLETRQKDEE